MSATGFSKGTASIFINWCTTLTKLTIGNVSTTITEVKMQRAIYKFVLTRRRRQNSGLRGE